MRMFLEIALLVVAIIILLFLFFYFTQSLLAPSLSQYQLGSVCFGERCFNVEIAKTQTERNRGLMFRKKLGQDQGMIFIFDKDGTYPFWMKNTLIPLDMIWIKEGPSAGSGQVVFIAKNIQPCKSLICPSVIPSADAKYVLEINAGMCERMDLKVGDNLKINIQI